MSAILKREMNAYFDSPLGYVFIAVYDLFAGYFFLLYNLYGNSTDMRALFEMMFTVTLFLIPVLTMRLMSEDKKARTDQLLLMSPVSGTAIVAGKFLAAVFVYLAAMAITLVQAAVLSQFAVVEWSVVLGHFIGLFLLGAALTAIGMIANTRLAGFVTDLSFQAHYKNFTYGLFNVADIVFYASVAGLFLFLTVCAFEKRRFE